jgi:negative regulator of sigma E activity
MKAAMALTAFLGVACLQAEVSRELNGNSAAGLLTKIRHAEATRSSQITVSSIRRYVLRNSRWKDDAVMHVRMTSTPGAGKQFEVISMENAGKLQKNVFAKVLEGEVAVSRKELSSAGPETETSLTPRNYDFAMLGTDVVAGRRCVVVQLIPKRKHKLLLNGKAWIDIEAEAIVQAEGQTADSVSFWIGKPTVRQHFQRVGDLWLPASTRSVSDVRFLGKTELSIEYLKYTVAASEVNVAAILR